MTELLFASMVLQWIVILVLGVGLLALARQIGVLHTRLAPAGALQTNTGPLIGVAAPVMQVPALDGRIVTVGGPQEAPQLVLFVSPTCPICKALVPTARSLARAEQLQLALASDGGERAAHEAYVRDMDLATCPYLLSTELGMRYEVGKLPYAILIDRDGILRAKGLVNSREHLESLVAAMETGHPSVQSWLAHEAGQTETAVGSVDPRSH